VREETEKIQNIEKGWYIERISWENGREERSVTDYMSRENAEGFMKTHPDTDDESYYMCYNHDFDLEIPEKKKKEKEEKQRNEEKCQTQNRKEKVKSR